MHLCNTQIPLSVQKTPWSQCYTSNWVHSLPACYQLLPTSLPESIWHPIISPLRRCTFGPKPEVMPPTSQGNDRQPQGDVIRPSPHHEGAKPQRPTRHNPFSVAGGILIKDMMSPIGEKKAFALLNPIYMPCNHCILSILQSLAVQISHLRIHCKQGNP